MLRLKHGNDIEENAFKTKKLFIGNLMDVAKITEMAKFKC